MLRGGLEWINTTAMTLSPLSEAQPPSDQALTAAERSAGTQNGNSGLWNPDKPAAEQRTKEPRLRVGLVSGPDGEESGPANELASTSSGGIQADHVNWNFSAMGAFQVLQRTGWIFKTESLIMPAVLDQIGGSAWLRGFLPMLNRFGQSIPPMIAAGRVRSAAIKKNWLAGTTALMGVIFLAIALLWQWVDTIPALWMSLAVLVLYAVFFAATGVNQLVQSALQGKLIPVRRRGELMTVSSMIGSVVAVLCAWVLLRRWMSGDSADFTSIFAFTGVLFLLGAVSALAFREKPDSFAPTPFSLRGLATDTLMVLRNDRDFRLVAITAALFGMMMTLFPHYQAVAISRLKLDLSSLVPWVIAQNLGVALFSLPVGLITDRYGNRLALRFVMFGLCLVPVAAILVSRIPGASGYWFLLVFGLLGLTPVTMRTFNNYTLELTDRSSQPRYLAILSLMMAGPAIFGSVAVGLLIDWFGFEPTFALVTACQLAGFAMTWWLAEPRDQTTRQPE